MKQIILSALTASTLLFSVSTVMACSPSTTGIGTSTDIQEIAWMGKGQDAVRGALRDPGSAEFADVYFCRGAEDIPVTCGSVNSKNGLGGHAGAQRFVSAGSADLTFLEEQVSGFSDIWNSFCRQ